MSMDIDLLMGNLVRRIDNMKIINNTNLSYKEIGEIIDEIISTSKGYTNYYGK